MNDLPTNQEKNIKSSLMQAISKREFSLSALILTILRTILRTDTSWFNERHKIVYHEIYGEI